MTTTSSHLPISSRPGRSRSGRRRSGSPGHRQPGRCSRPVRGLEHDGRVPVPTPHRIPGRRRDSPASRSRPSRRLLTARWSVGNDRVRRVAHRSSPRAWCVTARRIRFDPRTRGARDRFPVVGARAAVLRRGRCRPARASVAASLSASAVRDSRLVRGASRQTRRPSPPPTSRSGTPRLRDQGLKPWRTYDGVEVDLIVERDDGAVVAFEVKAAGRVPGDDFRGLAGR